ncbi:MAG TPA: RDD family protein [Anaerolineae bacterium]|nr:RDD family protein [Anaerolineae bacterium]HRJ57363.1 RDD family protein [Anaerolineales bacterium]
MYSGFWKRLRAFIWDYVLISAYILIITVIFWLLPFSQQFFADRIQAQLSVFFVLTFPIILYFSIFESSSKQGTWGKRKTKLITTGDNGDPVSFPRSFARTVLKLIPWELSHTLIWEIRFDSHVDPTLISIGFGVVYLLVGLNIASLIMTKKHQTLYDLITKTCVVYKNQ